MAYVREYKREIAKEGSLDNGDIAAQRRYRCIAGGCMTLKFTELRILFPSYLKRVLKIIHTLVGISIFTKLSASFETPFDTVIANNCLNFTLLGIKRHKKKVGIKVNTRENVVFEFPDYQISVT